MSVIAERSYALRRSIAMIADAPLVFLLSVTLSASALALPLAIASIALAVAPAKSFLQPAPEVSLFIARAARPADIESLKRRLASTPEVASATWVPRDVALKELHGIVGPALSTAELPDNPLPDVLIAHLRPGIAADRIESLAAEVGRWPHVETVRADTDWYRKLGAIARVAAIAAGALGLLVATLVALIIVGTVRLHAVARADEIEVLRISGASTGFSVRPYAYSAAATLACAAAFAIALVYAIHAALATPTAELARLYGHQFSLGWPRADWAAASVLIAGLVGWAIGNVGARVALRRLPRRS